MSNYRDVYEKFECGAGYPPERRTHDLFLPESDDLVGARMYRVWNRWTARQIAEDARLLFGDRLVAGQIGFKEPNFQDMSFSQLAQNPPFKHYVAEQLGITLESKVEDPSSAQSSTGVLSEEHFQFRRNRTIWK